MPVCLIVDPDTCIGSAECVALDPEAVELDESGVARVLTLELDEERAVNICNACPVGALTVSDFVINV
jgi:ferredoxin